MYKIVGKDGIKGACYEMIKKAISMVVLFSLVLCSCGGGYPMRVTSQPQPEMMIFVDGVGQGDSVGLKAGNDISSDSFKKFSCKYNDITDTGVCTIAGKQVGVAGVEIIGAPGEDSVFYGYVGNAQGGNAQGGNAQGGNAQELRCLFDSEKEGCAFVKSKCKLKDGKCESPEAKITTIESVKNDYLSGFTRYDRYERQAAEKVYDSVTGPIASKRLAVESVKEKIEKRGKIASKLKKEKCNDDCLANHKIVELYNEILDGRFDNEEEALVQFTEIETKSKLEREGIVDKVKKELAATGECDANCLLNSEVEALFAKAGKAFSVMTVEQIKAEFSEIIVNIIKADLKAEGRWDDNYLLDSRVNALFAEAGKASSVMTAEQIKTEFARIEEDSKKEREWIVNTIKADLKAEGRWDDNYLSNSEVKALFAKAEKAFSVMTEEQIKVEFTKIEKDLKQGREKIVNTLKAALSTEGRCDANCLSNSEVEALFTKAGKAFSVMTPEQIKVEFTKIEEKSKKEREGIVDKVKKELTAAGRCDATCLLNSEVTALFAEAEKAFSVMTADQLKDKFTKIEEKSKQERKEIVDKVKKELRKKGKCDATCLSIPEVKALFAEAEKAFGVLTPEQIIVKFTEIWNCWNDFSNNTRIQRSVIQKYYNGEVKLEDFMTVFGKAKEQDAKEKDIIAAINKGFNKLGHRY